MSDSSPTPLTTSVLAVLAWTLLAASPTQAQTSTFVEPDTFTATTTAMTPSDVGLRIVVSKWSDEESRAAVVAALTSEADVHKELAPLPNVGVVWESGSAVGYALKYAHRAPSEHGERLTFVTDRRLGSFGLKPWTANAAAGDAALPYSVIELYLNDKGTGTGNVSLVAKIETDKAAGLVSLATGASAPHVLKEATQKPKPYWLKDSP